MAQFLSAILAISAASATINFEAKADTVSSEIGEIWAKVGDTIVIPCLGDNSILQNLADPSRKFADIYSLRIFRNVRDTSGIIFTYLDLPPHHISRSQNQWIGRNVTFTVSKDGPRISLPDVTVDDDALYICDVTLASRNTAVMSSTHIRVVDCPNTVDVAITSAAIPLPANNSVNIPLLSLGSTIQARCTAEVKSSSPVVELQLSLPGLGLFDRDRALWRNSTTELVSHGDKAGDYIRYTAEASFLLDGPQNVWRLNRNYTLDCQVTVMSVQCVSNSSIPFRIAPPEINDVRS